MIHWAKQKTLEFFILSKTPLVYKTWIDTGVLDLKREVLG